MTDPPIEVRRHGTAGPLAAVLHGGPGAPGSAGSLARALAEGFRVLEPLQRRRDDRPLTVARHVADLERVLPEPTALVGWSWGAMLALSFAARHPSRATSLVLVGCGTYDLQSRAVYRSRASGTRVEKPADFDEIGHRETWDDAVRLQAEGFEPRAFSAIPCPVVMLHGEDDPHPGRMTYEVLRRWIPHLEYVGFPGAGHEPWLDDVVRAPFLRELRARLLGRGGGGALR
jgi:pimeloyl-ACP methyl ester carboxylesterase